MAAAPKVSHISAKARAADKTNLRKARAVARLLPRTGKQKAASRQSLVKARAAQKARRSGKGAVTAKKPQAALDMQLNLNLVSPGSSETAFSLHLLPVCGPVALAEHLAWMTGITVADEEILALHKSVQGCTLSDLLEYATAEGFSGTRLRSFQSCDPDQDMPGMVYGVQLDAGYHAVLRTPAGLVSWGLEMPLAGSPEEAWMLEWEEPGG